MQNKYINDFNESTLIYYKELKKYTTLTKQEERELLIKAKQGDTKSKNILIERNLKFVFNVAKQFKGNGVPIADLISEGNLGLEYAIQKFDTDRDVKLISYAVRWIQYYMQRCIKSENRLKTCEYESMAPQSNRKIYDNFSLHDSDNDASSDDIDMYTINDIEDVQDNTEERESNRTLIIKKVFEDLDEREKVIIEKYYGLNGKEKVKLKEIGIDIGVTAERVRQLRNIAFKKIKSKVTKNKALEDVVYSCLH